jgi:hypothetical protein
MPQEDSFWAGGRADKGQLGRMRRTTSARGDVEVGEVKGRRPLPFCTQVRRTVQ